MLRDRTADTCGRPDLAASERPNPSQIRGCLGIAIWQTAVSRCTVAPHAAQRRRAAWSAVIRGLPES